MRSRCLTLAAFSMLAITTLSCGLACSGNPAQRSQAKEQPPMDVPQLTLANKAIKLTIYLPDPDKGFYRATRFDRSGLIARAEFAGHTAYGPFRPKFDPLVNDNVVGPAEEFDMDAPPGYAEAKPGDPFVKIGVGVLRRPDAGKYDFFKLYPIVNLPEWKVASGKDWIEFTQELSQGPWGYAYIKRIELAPETTAFTLSHTLKNTGTRSIDTVMYCHNFTILDDDPVGPNYRVTFPFAATPSGDPVGPGIFKGNALTFPYVLKNKEPIWTQFKGLKGTVDENTFVVANAKKGVQLAVQGDQPPAMFRFYAEATAACPEPFVRIRVAPGKEKSWSSDYIFVVTPPAAK
jgi:hypothetical protein